MKKRSVALLISAISGLLVCAFLIYSFIGMGKEALTSDSSSELIGSSFAIITMIPQLVCALIALLFNIVSWAINSRPFALTSGILYSVTAILNLFNAVFFIIPIVFSFIGYAKLKKVIEYNRQTRSVT